MALPIIINRAIPKLGGMYIASPWFEFSRTNFKQIGRAEGRPAGAKAPFREGFGGTAEAVPFPNYRWTNSPTANDQRRTTNG
jgi:hypothetical protein